MNSDLHLFSDLSLPNAVTSPRVRPSFPLPPKLFNLSVNFLNLSWKQKLTGPNGEANFFFCY
ncbi:hypothetical protein LguiA_005152 [Lonicera macranthoides]